MRVRVAGFIGLFHLVGAVALWLLNAAAAAGPTVSQPISHVPIAIGERIILTREQQSEALASGTVDRPIKSLLAVRSPLRFGDFAWDDKNVAPGPIWIRVDMGSQLISVFRGADEIGAAAIVYGGRGKETPSGKFHILSKDRDHRSSLYDAAMPYTLQLTTDGVSIHGSIVRSGAATHGCIGLPLEFARKLFDSAKVGDEVVIVSPGSKARRTS
jgi:hypothetical protein